MPDQAPDYEFEEALKTFTAELQIRMEKYFWDRAVRVVEARPGYSICVHIGWQSGSVVVEKGLFGLTSREASVWSDPVPYCIIAPNGDIYRPDPTLWGIPDIFQGRVGNIFTSKWK